MGEMGATASGGARLGREERREALLDVAAQLVVDGSIEYVSMERVAEAARVSRPLVYKHFAGRDELLAAVYRREAAKLHEAMARDVAAATSLEDMFRRLVRAALQASSEQGPLFARLRTAGAWTRDVTREQRARDASTARAFSRRAADELGLTSAESRLAIRLLLGMVDHVLAEFRADPTRVRAARLEETYVVIVRATLAAVSAPSP
jgi:AcrR family transcriptional regulator